MKKRHPFQTRDLQVPSELQDLLAPALYCQRFTLTQKCAPDPNKYDRKWQYTAIAAQQSAVPAYAFVSIPCKFLEKDDPKNDDFLRRIFPVFQNWTVIIFTDAKRDFSSATKILLEDEAKEIWNMTIGLVKQNDMEVLRRIRISAHANLKLWTDRYLKLKDISSVTKTPQEHEEVKEREQGRMFPRTVEGEHDPRVRETTAMLGPLAATIQHKPGAQYGYLAGREAYREMTRKYPGFGGYLPLQRLRSLMDDYLASPRYQPRRFTLDLVPEWRAMFLLAWNECVMNETTILKEVRQGETMMHERR